GNYAICLHFDDEHNTGIYSWDTLYQLGLNFERNWQGYLQRLKAAGYERKEPSA
ncbi:MAG: gamma-butyrobetaine hydroxylase-like domain-containing protein, partial [Candidatus Thiodiazotropha sp.]